MPATSFEIRLLRLVLLAIVGRVVVVVSTSLYGNGGQSSLAIHSEIIGGATTNRKVKDTTIMEKKANNTNDFSASNVSSSVLDDVNATARNSIESDKEEYNQFSGRRKRFMNRIASVSSLLLRREHDASLDEEDSFELDNAAMENEVTPQSDLTRPGRHIHIVTTASLPWFTGTAVNPLLRAAYLHERLQQINMNTTTNKTSYVTLIIPWLELPEDQKQVYNGQVFATPQEQEDFVREWLRNQAGMPDAANSLNLHFYNARYHAGLGSVFAMGDIIQQLPQDELDVCVLEEPEQYVSSLVGITMKTNRNRVFNSSSNSYTHLAPFFSPTIVSIGFVRPVKDGRKDTTTSLESFIRTMINMPQSTTQGCGQLLPSVSCQPP